LYDEARRYYLSADGGVGRLPFRSAWAVATARHVYADIGIIVRQRGDRAWDSRAATSSVRKLARLTQACGEAAWGRAAIRLRPLPERGALWVPPMLRV
jgi:phytoene synthase